MIVGFAKDGIYAKEGNFAEDGNFTNVRMSDCVQGIEPCKCKGKGHQFRRLGF
jgi:hypothetical protein